MSTKSVLVCAVATVLFVFQLSFSYLTDTATESYGALSDKEVEALLAGEDPTDLLEPTAAGSPSDIPAPKAECRTGQVVADAEIQSLDQGYYVSFEEHNTTYIQISPWTPQYFTQDPAHPVSAKPVLPDKEIRDQLSQFFAKRDRCIFADLYLNHLEAAPSG